VASKIRISASFGFVWNAALTFSRAAGAQSSVSLIVFPGGFNWPIWVAQEKGYFARNGVDVKLTFTPNSVFQLLRRHYSRYTLDMVEKVCGIPKAKFEEVAKLYCSNSGPEKTGTITYALNLTQHTNGVQNIRALCMLQLLLGNIGRPGGGMKGMMPR
jgi:anaerobic selenocysteine-containing dehydrogenase